MPTLTLDTQFHVGQVDRRIFSGFAEHLGRCVYEGIYDPASPLSDAEGFRTDVIEKLRAIDMPLMRYPGGNFVSCYRWQDGIGPRDQRPRRPDFAWRSVETNQFGIDEFASWCSKVGTEPMMAVNLGTAGAQEAADLVEYCNLPAGTHFADRRAAAGRREPYGFKVWCLGNEMDGPWQAGHVPADEYARRASAAAKMMRGLDPNIETVLCGSSGRGMQTYLEYDRIALETCWNDVHYVSAHRYSNNRKDDSDWFLAEGEEIQRVIDDYRGLFDYVRGRKRADKRVYLSFDEWNVWYKNMEMDGKWQAAPHLLEEIYNVEDAVVCAQYLSAFVRNADVVKIACIAQIVNVIAPLLTQRDGLLVQSIYWPLLHFATMARGMSLVPKLDVPTYKAGERGEAPVADVAATLDESTNTLALFVINRNRSAPLEMDVKLTDRAIARVIDAVALGGGDVKAANTWESPETVTPVTGDAKRIDAHTLRVRVPAPGYSVVRASLD